MSAPSFTYSGNVYTAGTAGAVDFALVSTTGNAIPYLEPSHIHVYKSSNQGSSWSELSRPSQWDFATSGTVARLVTGIAAGEWVKVQRITPSSSAYVTFQPSSLLTADQLNDESLFNTYLNQELFDQGNQSATTAASAEAAATAATTAANAATTAAATATSTANAASSTAATALSTANTASTNAAAAVNTANTASTNAAAAVSTANTASTNATTALNSANTASTNAAAAVTTANTAATNAASAVSTANSAASDAATALSTANSALSTANSASASATSAASDASTALSTANTANANAAAALNAVASSVQYQLVANVAAIPASPADGDAVEVADSTGIQSFTPLANIPAGFVGDTGLSVRMQYTSSGSTWNWLNYFANDSDTRYLKKSGGTLTGALTLHADPTQNLQAATKQYVDNVASSGGLPLTGGTMTGQILGDNSTSPSTPGYAFDNDANTGLFTTGADEVALATGGVTRLTIDSAGAVAVTGTASVGGQAVVVDNDARLTDARTPTDGSVTDAKVSAAAAIAGSKIQAATTSNAGAVQLTDSTSSTSTTTAATPASVKSAYDLANAALPKAGGAMTGDLTLNAQSDLRFADSGSSNWVAFQAPATVSSNVTWTLPSADGTASQVLSTNGSGTLSWTTPAGGGASVTTSDTAPSTPSDGDLWYDSVGGRLYVYYDDGNTSQWVDAAPQGGSAGGASVTVGETAPTSPTAGDLWFDNTTTDARLYIYYDDGNTQQWIDAAPAGAGGGGTPTKIEVGNTKAEVTDTGSDGAFVVTAEGTERLRVTSDGKLGLGTSSVDSRFVIRSHSGVSDTPILKIEHPSNDADFAISGLFDSDGSTTYLGSNLYYNSSYAVARFDTGKPSSAISLSGRTGNGEITFFTGSGTATERMRIRSDGYSLFGCTALPSSSVVGLSFSPSITATAPHYSSSGSTTSGVTHFQFINGNGVVGAIVTNGSATAYNTSSDYRLKENVVPLTGAADRLKQIPVHRFNFIGDPNTTVDGFIAHEAQAIVPECVTGEKDAVDENGDPIYQGIDQSKLVPLLTAALQESIARIETQGAAIAALEAANAAQAATIAALDTRLNALEAN